MFRWSNVRQRCFWPKHKKTPAMPIRSLWNCWDIVGPTYFAKFGWVFVGIWLSIFVRLSVSGVSSQQWTNQVVPSFPNVGPHISQQSVLLGNWPNVEKLTKGQRDEYRVHVCLNKVQARIWEGKWIREGIGWAYVESAIMAFACMTEKPWKNRKVRHGDRTHDFSNTTQTLYYWATASRFVHCC